MKISIIKRLFGDLIAGAVAVLLICLALTAPYQIEVYASAPGPISYSEPAEGVGRIENSEFGMRNSELSPHPSRHAATPSPQGEGFDEDVIVSEKTVEVIPEAEPVIESDIDALIVEAAERYGLPWQLVSAVVWAESRYDPDAVSSTPDFGFMQVTQSVMGSYGLTADNWMDPAANLDAGCRILREKLDLSGGDAAAALTRYRFGDAEALAMWSRGEWSNWYNERVLGKYYEILREG